MKKDRRMMVEQLPGTNAHRQHRQDIPNAKASNATDGNERLAIRSEKVKNRQQQVPNTHKPQQRLFLPIEPVNRFLFALGGPAKHTTNAHEDNEADEVHDVPRLQNVHCLTSWHCQQLKLLPHVGRIAIWKAVTLNH